MKKSLVLAMAMALGVTASAYAANPFSDVPAGHWAYDSVSKLAAAGVVDGYPNGTFGGERLMTRYEMAQIVAKAMAKGANVDRLAAEFADELDSLGVRVAALEKKSDNVKITGEFRARYVHSKNKATVPPFEGPNEPMRARLAAPEPELGSLTLKDNSSDLRSRLWVHGQINDDWKYVGMLQNTQNLRNEKGDEGTYFQRAYVEGKIGGLDVTAGRYNMFLGNGNIYDTRADGIELSYGNKVKFSGVLGKASDDISVVPSFAVQYSGYADFPGISDAAADGSVTNGGNYFGGSISGDIGNVNLSGGYYKFKDIGKGSVLAKNPNGPEKIEVPSGIDNGIWFIGAEYKTGNFGLNATYLKGDLKTSGNLSMANEYIDTLADDDGFVIGLNYKGAEAADPGSWGLFANYYDQGAQTYIAHTTDAETFGMTGFKGYGVGANYTVAKNVVATLAYYDTKSKLADKLASLDENLSGVSLKSKKIWADLTFTF